MEDSPGRARTWAWLGLAGLALAFAAGLLVRVVALWPFTVDDTYITLQYSRHLAEGHGPAWNIGGPPTEGYTTVLWMLVLTLVELVGIDGVLGAKLLSVLFALASIGLSSWLAWECCHTLSHAARRVAAAIPFALAAPYWQLAVHAVSGMETTFTAALIAGLSITLVRAERLASPRAFRQLALYGLALTLARPEAALFPALSVPLVCARLPGAARLPLVRAVVLCAVLPGALYFAARYAYFGLPFPLPFYIKAAGHGGLAGSLEVQAFFVHVCAARPLVPLLVACAAWALPASRAPLLGGAALALFFMVPSHIMGFESRYLQPVVPVLFGLSGAGGGVLCAWLAQRYVRAAGLVEPCAISLAFVSALAPYPAGYAPAVEHWRAYGAGLQTAHLALARDLEAHAGKAPTRVIAMLDVGAVAYRSRWTVIDTYGLNDARVALSKRTDVDYIFAQMPDLVVIISESATALKPVFDWEAPIAARAAREGFVAVKSYPFEFDYHLRVFARAGSALAAALEP